MDSLELQLASAVQRFNSLQRRAETHREPGTLLTKALAELGTALEELRVAQEQLVEDRERLERLNVELRQQHEKYWQLFDDMPQAYLLTKTDSTIVEVNKAAAQLLNVSQRFLIGKTLSVFVCEERTQFLHDSARAASQDTPIDMSLKVRPRERAPIAVSARVSGGNDSLRWVIRPVETTTSSGPEAVSVSH